MKFWLATLVWLLISVILGWGIYRLVYGKALLFIVSVVGILALISYFCATTPGSEHHSDHH